VAEDTTVSPEAFERVRRERDELKSKMAEAETALRDFNLIDNAHAHFRSKGLPNAYDLARAAVEVNTLKGVKTDELPHRLDDWLERQRNLWAAPAHEPVNEPESAPAVKASPYQGPNPGTPGFATKVEPMIVGGEQWQAWKKDKSPDEQLAAMRRGDAVTSDQVKRFQKTARTGV